ncbi:hypothetical protein SDC9_105842 [bioreactor metagenome]|uniref:Uncharacterized protein n=1 Tax=bioreactor metagenome TaxID=1076179 RepID=A0A645B0L1_9ZZZZ
MELFIVGQLNARQLHGQCSQHVGADGHAVLLRDIVVGPDEKRNLILLEDLFCGAVIQLLAVQLFIEIVAQRRLMVAEEDDHGPLVRVLIVFDQLPDGVVTFLDKGEILGRHGGRSPTAARQFHGSLQVVPALSVAAVVLHGDVKHEQGVLRLIGQAVELLIVGGVADIVAYVLGINHVLLIHLLVKAHPAVNGRPVPAGGEVGVERYGVIAQSAHLRHQRGHSIVAVKLIGHGRGGQKCQRVSGQVLKFHIGGAAAGDGGDHHAFYRILRQRVIKGQRVLGQFQAGKTGLQIREGLVHDDQQVFRRLRVRRRPADGAVGDPLSGVGGVAVRRGDKAVPQGGHEIQ